MPSGGTARLTVSRVPQTPGDGNGNGAGGQAVEVRIQDSGPGIAPSIRERLFEPFVSSKETGLGLGLSICKRLIDGHNGTIRGADAADGGALFAFTLPV